MEAQLQQVFDRRGKKTEHSTNIHYFKWLAEQHPLVEGVDEHKESKGKDRSEFDSVGPPPPPPPGALQGRVGGLTATASGAPSASASGEPSDVADTGPLYRDFSDGGGRGDLSDFRRIGPGRFWRRPS